MSTIERKPAGLMGRVRSAWHGLMHPLADSNMEGSAVTSPADLARELRSGTRSSTGHRITTDSAMRAGAVFACVKVISEDIAAMPLNIYRLLEPRGKVRAPEHRLYKILHSRPNHYQTSMQFREMMQMFLLLRGNAYALKTTVRGQLDELLPFHPDHVTPRLLPGLRMQYEVQPPLGGPPQIYDSSDILHIVGLSANGFTGLSVIEYAKNAIGMAEAQEGFGAEAFRDGGVNRVALKHPKELTQGAADRLRNSWIDIYGGPGRYAKPAVLEEGMDVVKIGLSAADMQFLDGRKFQLEDIARFFRVTPQKIGDLSRATNNNVEQMSLDHVTSTLLPWCVRWEEKLEAELMDRPADSKFFIKHVIDAHLRGDPVKRHQTYASGRQWGYYSANDVRELEDLNPIEGGDSYMVPLNTRDADEPAPGAEPDPMTASETTQGNQGIEETI